MKKVQVLKDQKKTEPVKDKTVKEPEKPAPSGMTVVIPAGGKGSRMQPYSSLLPKVLLPVGGKPVIWWIVQNLMKHGFNKMVICVNKKDTSLFSYELRDYKMDITIVENDRPLGSAGEILGAKEDVDDTFLVHYSDELTPINLTELVGFHKVRKTSLGTLGLVRNIPLDVGLVELDGNKVKRLVEKPMLNQLAWAGIAVFEPDIFDYIEIGDDFSRNVFPKVINSGKRLFGYQSPVLWLDVGSISHYRRACRRAEEGKL